MHINSKVPQNLTLSTRTYKHQHGWWRNKRSCNNNKK